MKITPITTSIFKENDDLMEFIFSHTPELKERNILATTSKIVALAEGRTYAAINEEDKEKLIKSESQIAIPTKHVWVTIKDGMLVASSGIDDSNGNGKLILLPKDSFASASKIRTKLQQRFNVKKLGVIITDGRIMPLRAGALGMAVGYAGFKGLKDYRGTPDIFGRTFVFETMNLADSLATAATLTMGEGNEQRPLAIIEEAEIDFQDEVDRSELLITPEDDLYRPILNFGLK